MELISRSPATAWRCYTIKQRVCNELSENPITESSEDSTEEDWWEVSGMHASYSDDKRRQSFWQPIFSYSDDDKRILSIVFEEKWLYPEWVEREPASMKQQ